MEIPKNKTIMRLAEWIQSRIERHRCFPMIRIVDRYLVWEFVKALLVVVAMFYVIGVVIVLFDEIDAFLEHGASFSVALKMVLFSAPYRLAESGPLVMLLAAVFSVGRLVHSREIDAMIIGGYRLRRLLVPLVSCAVVCALAFFLVCEHVIAPWSAEAEDLMDLHIKPHGEGPVGRKSVWMLGQNKRKYYVELFEPAEGRLHGVDVLEMADDGFQPARRIKANEALWDSGSGVWQMSNGTEWIFKAQGEAEVHAFKKLDYLVEETPRDFSLVSQDEKALSHADLSHLVRMIRRAGGDPVIYLPYLRLREALPFSLIIMSVLGLGLAVHTGRGGYVLGLGISLLVAVVFYGILLLCLSCAQKGILSAWLAAWIPNITLGTAMFWHLHQLDQTT
ncbi:MAG: LptF/LptG family permease [bacterium]